MNGKERILAAFRGETPDFIPFAPNVYLWFYYHQFKGTLPAELQNATHPLDAVRYLGGDILARWDILEAVKEIYPVAEYFDEFSGEHDFGDSIVTAFNTYPPYKCERQQSLKTPYGNLTQTWKFSSDAGADYESKHWWTDWSEYRAVRYMVEAKEFSYDYSLFPKWAEKIGDQGLMMVSLPPSPLKALHWLAGAENATLFIMDHPEEMKELANIHAEKTLALLEKIVDQENTEIFISPDNLDSAFHSPKFYRQFCSEYYTRAADIIHNRGKLFLVHACGRGKALLPMVGGDKIDCLEGLTPPPLGDVTFSDVRRLTGFDKYTVNGGMDTQHLEVTHEPEKEIHAYTRSLFESMGDKRHFIFASSCATTPMTPWKNLIYFRDAAREYGRI